MRPAARDTTLIEMIGYLHFARACMIVIAAMASGWGAVADDQLEQAQRFEARRIAMIARVSPAVVCIFDENQLGGGSGVLIDAAGYGLTNYHVVQPMLENRKGLGGLSDGKLYELRVLGIDPGGDVAMFRLMGRDDFPFAVLGDSDRVRAGDAVVAMGNPFMLSEDYTPTVSWGIVSGVHRYQRGRGDTLLYSDCIQVDAPINPGNSGGPLFSADGEVIGINGRISVSMRGRLNVGLGYAITANQIKPFVPGLAAGLLVRHGTLQCVVEDHPTAGVICTQLLEDAPAYRAGIRPGDRILRFLDRDVLSANHYASLLGTLPAHWPVPISYSRPSGEIVHRIVRTEPVRLHGADRFKPDPAAGATRVDELLRVVRRLRLTSEKPPTPERPWIWRQRHIETDPDPLDQVYRVVDDGGPEMVLRDSQSDEPVLRVRRDAVVGTEGGEALSVEQSLVLQSLFAFHRAVVPSSADRSGPSGIRPVGADRLIELDDSGRVTVDQMLEVLETDLGPHQTARFEFDARTHGLVRIVALDELTGDQVPIAIEAPSGLPKKATIADGSWRIEQAGGLFDARSNPFARRAGRSDDGDGGRGVDGAVVGYVSQRVVRLIGAKAGLAKGYGSGIIVSPDGYVLTVDSIVLDSNHIRAYLSDGTLAWASVVYADRSMQLALLKLEAATGGARGDGESPDEQMPYPYFELDERADPPRGAWVMAAGNPFKVAAGAEPVSVALGVLGGRIKLDATRLTRDFPYRGDVLVIDAVTSTPGFAGGAVVDLAGHLVGMVGRVIQARATNTNLNHAYPVDVLMAFYRRAMDPQARTEGDGGAKVAHAVYHGMKFFELGYRSNPVYVDRVRRGSPARKAGVRKDDLIVQANGHSVPNLKTLERIIGDLKPGDTLQLIVMRKDKAIPINVALEEAGP